MLPPLMRVGVAVVLSGALVVSSASGAEAPPPAAGSPPVAVGDFPRLVLDSGRVADPLPDPEAYRFLAHGEFQLRYQALRSFPLVATASAIAEKPGLVEQSIGQNHFVHHWLRLRPRLQVRDLFDLVGQVDLTGLLVGELARDTRADLTPRDERNGFSNVQLRWLYGQYRLPFGLIRIGQQPNHWGMGVLTNDGDHPLLFGDYRYGAISERVLFATRPGGKDSDFYLGVAGDLVFRDSQARLTRGEQAFQGVLAAYWERGANKLGVFSMFRHQENDRTSGSSLFSYADELDTVSIDVHGRIVAPVPGDANALAFAEVEAAYVLGSTTLLRTPAQALERGRTEIRSYGGAAVVGVAHSAAGAPLAKTERLEAGRSAVTYGDVVGQVEVGYASGDADPYDSTQKRFVFDPNHRIGLLLFDEILRFQTARAATAAIDPLLANAARPIPGAEQIASNGGVFGAQYINPTVIYRPRYWLDLKGGLVIAQATSDIVDPYRVATGGSYVNYRGGDSRKKDLGVELDGGVEARFPLPENVRLQVGAQAGVLFPGGALEDARGSRLPVQWVSIARLGLLF